MKILWLCNVPTEKISVYLGEKAQNFGGWLSGASEKLLEDNNIELGIVFPHKSKKVYRGNIGRLSYYSFYTNHDNCTYDSNLENVFSEIIQQFTPDIIHIWGTEFPHSLAMAKVFDSQCLIVSIQGLCSVIADHYMACLPPNALKYVTFRDILKKDTLIKQQTKFRIRGNFEKETLKLVSNVIGRTNWDRICSKQINPKRNYFKCNETLRDIFYQNQGLWNPDFCEKNSIFVSQGSYPVKGFHFVIEALNILVLKYPEIKLFVTGKDIFSLPWYRINGYQLYLKQKIEEYGLKKNIIFLGDLSAEKMCHTYLRSNVFICPSSIENSSNSIGEAMLLGMPVISSYVGGSIDLIEHEKEGFLYPLDEPYILAHYIEKIFDNPNQAERIGTNAYRRAKIIHDKDVNCNQMKEIYTEILNEKRRYILKCK